MSARDVTRSGFVAVVGRPNAGKSTLINQLVGEHVAIVSPIAQTTRRVVRAVVTRGETQIVFVDLPGSQRPVDRLTARMQHAVVQSFGDVDAVLWVIDMTEDLGKGEQIVADMVLAAELPVVIAANKVDQVKPHDLLRRITELAALIGEREYHALVPMSAITGEACDVLVDELSAIMPEGPAYFPDDELTDMRDSERIAEYVREALLAHMRDELPHATIVSVEDLAIDDDGRLDIDCVIWVERESQVGIVVGRSGATIRDTGIAARAIIEDALDERVHLRLRVKVRKRWRDDDTWLARAGL